MDFSVDVLSVEYPGYGIYEIIGNTSERKILQDAEIIYDYIYNQMKYDIKNVIFYGRSIGTGPASYLASKFECGGLVLCSSYTSVRDAAKFVIKNKICGCCSCASFTVPNIFRNRRVIMKVKCPILLIHGEADKVTPYKGAKLLY
jgi:dienelactone hydrolase